MLLRFALTLTLALLASGCGLLRGEELQNDTPPGGMDAGLPPGDDAGLSRRDAAITPIDATRPIDSGRMNTDSGGPGLGEFGDPCLQGSECASGHCLDFATSPCRRGFCTVECATDEECVAAIEEAGHVPPGPGTRLCVMGTCNVGPILCDAMMAP